MITKLIFSYLCVDLFKNETYPVPISKSLTIKIFHCEASKEKLLFITQREREMNTPDSVWTS